MILKKIWKDRGTSVVTLVLVGASLALAGCTSSASPSTPGIINVVGAEAQYGDVLAQLGGAFVHVTSIVDNPNTDPHNFEASPSVARTIAAASIVVQNGDGYDSFMNQLESASPNSSRAVITVAALRDQAKAANPHFWFAPTTMPMLARVVTRDLISVAAHHAAYFRSREATFLRSWGRVTAAVASARRRFEGKKVATTEPVGDYLLSAMGLENLTPFRFQGDVMNGIDPSPQDIVTQQDLLSRHEVAALCFNAQVSSPVTRALRDLATKDHVPGAAIYEIMPQGLHVQTWMLDEITAISAAVLTVVKGSPQ